MEHVSNGVDALASHASFDAHYLRAFAEALPFYFQPGFRTSPFSIKDIVDRVNERVFSVPSILQIDPGMMRVLQGRQYLRMHLAYTLADTFLYCHVGGRTNDEAFSEMQKELQRIDFKRKIVFPNDRHPLFRWYKASDAVSVTDMPIRVLDAQRDDRVVAQCLRSPGTLEMLVKQQVPELLSLDPACEIHRHWVEFRSRFKEHMEADSLREEQRRDCVDQVFDAWAALQVGQGEDMALALEDELNILNVTAVNPAELLKRLVSVCNDASSTRRFIPLMEQYFFQIAIEGDFSSAVQAISTLVDLLKKHHVAVCDYPGLGLAFFALRVRHLSREVILQALG